jgi:hypothetical protein
MSGDPDSRPYTPAHAAIVEKIENIRGFVSLIDVLGFRELVGRDDRLTEVREYVETVASILQDKKYEPLQFVLFSDNLVINTQDEKPASFLSLMRACSDVFFNLTQRRIAIRGAVAHGLFMRSPNTQQGVVLAGRPIVEADHYQHCQDWVGIILAPSVVRQQADLEKELALKRPNAGETGEQWYLRAGLTVHLQRWPNIPFHPDGHYDGYAIIPVRQDSRTPAEIRDSLRVTLADLEKMRAAAPDPLSQQKYANSLSLLNVLDARWADEARSNDFMSMPSQATPWYSSPK